MTIKAPSQYSSYHTKVARNRATSEPVLVRWLLITLMLAFLTLFLIVPLAAVFTEALRKGYFNSMWFKPSTDPSIAGINCS